jgi:hypothetical protein
MNLMFERLRIQANLRRLTETYGRDTALELYRTALQRELDRQQREKDNSAPSRVV